MVCRNGLLAFTGRTGNVPNFTPAQSYSRFSKSLRRELSELRVTPPNQQWPSAAPVSFPVSARDLHLRSVQR